MDDTDDKARRNLLLVSTLVLLGAWLNVPDKGIVKRILGDEISGSVNTSRVWVAIALLLVYLVHRYWHSSECVEARKNMGDEFRTKLSNTMEVWLRIDAWLFFRIGVDSHAMHGNLGAWISQRTPLECRDQRASLERPRVEISAVLPVEYRSGGPAFSWDGAITLRLSWHDGRIVDDSDTQLGFEFAGIQRLAVRAIGFVRLLLLSQSTTRFLVPAASWLSAVGVVIYRLSHA